MPFSEDVFGRLLYNPNGPDMDFPTKNMPDPLSDSILETANDLGLPIPLVAQAAMAASSLANQRVVDIQYGAFPPAPVGEFHLTVVQSSRGKSACVERYMHPFKSTMEKENQELEATQSERRADQTLWEEDRVILLKQYRAATPDSDEWRRLRPQIKRHEMYRPKVLTAQEMYYEDLITPAALRDAFVANPNVGIICPDAGPLLAGPLFSQTAVLTKRWSGEGGTTGRASGNRRISKPRLMMGLMIQDELFEKFVAQRGDDASHSGFFSRCLVANPIMRDVPGTLVRTGSGNLPKLEVFHNRILEILRLPMASANGRMILTLSKEAELHRSIALQWVHDHMICNVSYSENIKLFFRRIGEHYNRLAAQFHRLQCSKDPIISVVAMKNAIEVCEWYMWEFIRTFSRYSASDKQVNQILAEKLCAWLSDAFGNSMRYPDLTPGQYTLRDLQQYSPIRNKADLISTIELLASQGALTIGYGRRGGMVVYFPPMSCNTPSVQFTRGVPIQSRSVFKNRG